MNYSQCARMKETTASIKDDKLAMDEHSWMLPRDASNQEKKTTSGTHEHSHENEQNEVCIVFEVPLKEEDGPSGSVRRLPKHVDRRRSLSTYSDGFSLDLSEQTPISMLTLDLTPTSVKQINSKVALNKKLSNTDKEDNNAKTRIESTHEHSHEHSYEQMIFEVEAKVEKALQQSKNYKTQRRGKERTTNHSHNKNSNRASSRQRYRKVAKDKHHDDKAAQMTRNYRSSKRDNRKDTIRKNRIESSQQDYSRSFESEGKHATNTQITNGTAHPVVGPKRGGEKRDPPGSRFTFGIMNEV